MFPVRYELDFYILFRRNSAFKGLIAVDTIYTTFFNTLKLRILPTQCIFVFRMVLTINSDCFPKQH
jgi:hypothetical protein